MLTRRAITLTATISACPSQRSQACPQVNPACRRQPPASATSALVSRAGPRRVLGAGRGAARSHPGVLLAQGWACQDPVRRQGCGPSGPKPLGSAHGHSPQPVTSRAPPCAATTGRPAASLAHRVSGPLPPQAPGPPPSPTQVASAARPAPAMLRLISI